MDYRLDLTHYRCPLPLLMTQKALRQLPQGARLSVLLKNSNLNDFYLLAHTLHFHCHQQILNEEQIELLFSPYT